MTLIKTHTYFLVMILRKIIRHGEKYIMMIHLLLGEEKESRKVNKRKTEKNREQQRRWEKNLESLRIQHKFMDKMQMGGGF